VQGEEVTCQSCASKIRHPTSTDGKRAFDGDPVGRERSGVRRYQIPRSMDDPNDVTIDLDVDTKDEAEALLAAMREVWRRVEGTIMMNPQARIVATIESKEY
jgi:hypothetical protein